MNQIATELKEEHQAWLSQIRGWEAEIGMLSKANGELSTRAQSMAQRAKLDHFENRFTIELNRLDGMKHNIKTSGGVATKGQAELDEYAQHFASLREEFARFGEEL